MRQGLILIRCSKSKKVLESKVDVSIYADPKFDCDQMFEICIGLKEGVDVSIYADPKFDCDQMRQIRLKLEKGTIDPADGEQACTNSMNLF